MVELNNIVESSMVAEAKEATAIESDRDKEKEVQIWVKSHMPDIGSEDEICNDKKHCSLIRGIKIFVVFEMAFEAAFIFIVLLKLQGIHLIGDLQSSENAGQSTCELINNYFGYKLATERNYYLEWSNLIYPAMAFTWGLSLFIAVHKKELQDLNTSQIYMSLFTYIAHLIIPFISVPTLCLSSNFYSLVDSISVAIFIRTFLGLAIIIVLCGLISAIKNKDSPMEIRSKPWPNFFKFYDEISATNKCAEIPGDIAAVKTLILFFMIPAILELNYVVGRRISNYISQQSIEPSYHYSNVRWMPFICGERSNPCVRYLEDNSWHQGTILYLSIYCCFLVIKLLIGIAMWKTYGNVKTHDQVKVTDTWKYFWIIILTIIGSIGFIYQGFTIKIYEFDFIYPTQICLVVFVFIPMICFLALIVLNKYKKNANNSNE